MTDIANKYSQMVDRLYDKTAAGKLDWEMSWLHELTCSVGSYRIKLKATRGDEGEPYEILEVVDSNDKVIDSFNDAKLSSLKPADGNFESYFAKMEALRLMARRQALGADKALDQILEELDDDIPF